MTINPIAFAEDVNRQFLRYQLTAFPLSDPDMNRQAREMLGQGKRDSQRLAVSHPTVTLSTRRADIRFWHAWSAKW